MSTTGSNFVLQVNPSPILQGSTVLPAGQFIAVLNPVQALEAINAAPPAGSGVSSGFTNNSATPLDRIIFDLALLSIPPEVGTDLLAWGKFIGGFAKNGALWFSLTGVTPVTIDFTALATAVGVTSAQGGDSSLATLNSLAFQNLSTAASTIVVSPGASNPLTLPNALGGTAPTISLLEGDVHCEYSAAGKTVNGTAKTLTFTPTAGGIIAIAYGGA